MLEYNSQQKQLLLPEYGRNVQQMVDHCLTIEDREERTRCAYTIVNIMSSLVPHLREIDDFKHKLWGKGPSLRSKYGIIRCSMV